MCFSEIYVVDVWEDFVDGSIKGIFKECVGGLVMDVKCNNLDNKVMISGILDGF